MKASELITLLQDAIDKYGDLPVRTGDYDNDELDKVDLEVMPYTVNGLEAYEETDIPDHLMIDAY